MATRTSATTSADTVAASAPSVQTSSAMGTTPLIRVTFRYCYSADTLSRILLKRLLMREGDAAERRGRDWLP